MINFVTNYPISSPRQYPITDTPGIRLNWADSRCWMSISSAAGFRFQLPLGPTDDLGKRVFGPKSGVIQALESNEVDGKGPPLNITSSCDSAAPEIQSFSLFPPTEPFLSL